MKRSTNKSGLSAAGKLLNFGLKDADTVDKSQEESEEDEMLQQARVYLDKFNEKIAEENSDFAERNVSFDGLSIMNDSQDVCFTYVPKDGIPNNEISHPNAVQEDSDLLGDSSDSENTKLT